MKVKLYLHGHLKNKIQKDFVEVEADTLLDALRNLEMKYRKVLKAPLDIGKWRIKVKDFEDRNSWSVPLFVNEVHIYPVFHMGKSQGNSAMVQIGIGVALIAVTVLTGGLGAAAAVAAGTSTGLTTLGGLAAMSAISMGIGLMAQGLLTMLFPQPTPDTVDNNSKYLGVAQNTTKAGTRIPFGYGRYKIGGQILSYNVSANNLKVYGG